MVGQEQLPPSRPMVPLPAAGARCPPASACCCRTAAGHDWTEAASPCSATTCLKGAPEGPCLSISNWKGDKRVRMYLLWKYIFNPSK